MNPYSAAVLLAAAVAATFVPWRRPDWEFPTRGLVRETGIVIVALFLAWGAARLGHPGGTARWWGRLMLVVAAYWYAVVGGVGLVRLVLGLVPVSEPPTQSADGIAVPHGELARGRLIGILERALVVTLVLVGEFGALGLIVAAKAVARFRGLEDRDFAEYFLIGTLASLLVAVVVGIALRAAF